MSSRTFEPLFLIMQISFIFLAVIFGTGIGLWIIDSYQNLPMGILSMLAITGSTYWYLHRVLTYLKKELFERELNRITHQMNSLKQSQFEIISLIARFDTNTELKEAAFTVFLSSCGDLRQLNETLIDNEDVLRALRQFLEEKLQVTQNKP